MTSQQEFPKNPILELKNISAGYADYPVLHQVNLQIFGSEVVCVLGPSGCGKSTLLKIAGSFLAPKAGSVVFQGKGVTNPDHHRLMVFQNQNQLLPWMTLEQNIRFALKHGPLKSHPSSWRERIAKSLQEVGLQNAAKLYPHQLSGGMAQRGALARAFGCQPALLLMDEPFGSVDAPTRSELQHLLLDLIANHHTATLFVTHDLEEALLLGHRILVLNSRGFITLDSRSTKPGHPSAVRQAMEHPDLRANRYDRP